MTRAATANGRYDSADDIALPPQPGSIMLVATALVAIGVTMIFSASSDLVTSGLSEVDVPQSASTSQYLLATLEQLWKAPGLRQLFFVPVGLIAMLIASHCPYTFWRMRERWWLSPPVLLLFVSIALLAGVLIAPESIAPHINGAKRWYRISVGGLSINFQPSELAKLAIIVFLAAALSDDRFDVRRFFKGLLPLALAAGVTLLLIIKEDFGTAALLTAVVFFMLLAGGARKWHLLAWIPPVVPLGYWFLRSSEYRWQRVLTWWTGGDPNAEGYHIHQSLLAIASGSWLGRGLGEGIQKLGYLPEDTTDFIFPIICEEAGLVGGFLVIGLFILLLWQLRPTRLACDRMGQLIKLGVALLIGLQAAMNIAVVTGTVPAKGIALPFVSAGGSGLVILSIALGLAANVNRQTRSQFEAR